MMDGARHDGSNNVPNCVNRLRWIKKMAAQEDRVGERSSVREKSSESY